MINLPKRIINLINKANDKRNKNLSFGPIFSNERTYFNLNQFNLIELTPPTEISKILEEEGYICLDYRKGYAYKKDYLGKNKPSEKILTVLSKKLVFKDKNNDRYFELKKKFDTRLKSNRKEAINCKVCISYNPFDVALMSTNRSWSTCMNLIDGLYKTTPYKQITYGGMCAYLIIENDDNINEPIARIAIKRLVGKGNDFIFVSENKIYGDNSYAKEVNFNKIVENILVDSNRQTAGNSNIFVRKDRGSYSDSDIDKIYKLDFLNEDEMIHYMEKHGNLFENEIFYKSVGLFKNIEKLFLSNKFIKTFKDNLSWDHVSKYLSLPFEFIEKYKNNVNWFNISKHQILSEIFITKFKRFVNWDNISEFQNLSEEFIEKNKNKVNWYNISKHQKLSEAFIRKHKRKVYWNAICETQKLSMSFLEEFKNKISWFETSIHQKLTEDFIDKYKEKLDWDNISEYQKLSEKFIEDHKDYVNIESICKSQKVSKEFKKRIKKYLCK